MSTVISVENLSKQYRLGQVGTGTLADDLNRWWCRLRGKEDPFLKVGQVNDRTKKAENGNGKSGKRSLLSAFKLSAFDFPEFIWALKDVNFEVKQGEVLGIIGRNGAGKSTLLKILSRVTTPTTGQVKVKGRIASLLEVGTGFHPDLSGRENIYLNGAILGMRKHEITRRLDEIIDFSGCERYIDTPVKRYSSGMYVRLAFAVAAHLEPEVLIIDEVLAVGDAEFQKKCLGKMQDVALGGRTVLFVSHNLNAIESLCSHVVHLEMGGVRQNTNAVRTSIDKYLAGKEPKVEVADWRNKGNQYSNGWFLPSRFFIGDENGVPFFGPIANDVSAFVNIDGYVDEPDASLCVGYAIYDSANSLIYCTLHTDTSQTNWPKPTVGLNRFRSELPRRLLNEGKYRLELHVSLYSRKWICNPGTEAPAIQFTIKGGLSDSPRWTSKRSGCLGPVIDWHIVPVDNDSQDLNSCCRNLGIEAET